MSTESAQQWELDKWPEAEREFPEIARDGRNSVGVPLTMRRTVPQIYRHFEQMWYKRDIRIWDMPPFKRDEWFNFIMGMFWTFERRIRYDGTKRFKKQIKKLLEKGGFVCVIGKEPSGKGDGKSILAQMIIHVLREEFGIEARANILFEHGHMRLVIEAYPDSEEVWIILVVDEDLTAHGEGSSTLMIKILNTWQTNRKPKLIIISVGVDPKSHSSAVDLHLIPAGICEKHQTTRFACFAKGKFLCWARLQRKFRPEFEVLYGQTRELGTLAEYKARAVAHSVNAVRSGVGAYSIEQEQADIDLVLSWLEYDKREYEALGREWGIPKVDVIVTEVKQWGFPTETMKYPYRIVSTAVRRFERANPEDRKRRTEEVNLSEVEIETAEFWEDYQTVVYSRYPNEYPFADRDAWMVTYRQMGFKDREIKEKFSPPLTMRVNSIGERIRKGVSEWNVLPSNTELGSIAEKFIGSRIDSYVPRCEYIRDLSSESSRRDVPDISDSGSTRNARWAINVKASMENDFDRVFETSPEHLVEHSWCVFLFPKTARLAIAPIHGENTRYNSKGMVLCGIQEGIEKTVEMIEGAD